MDLSSPQFWIAVGQIILVNILLSGDNAVVIALACRNLPPRQRRMGILWGVVGAVVLRIVLTFFAVRLLDLPYLKLVGAALLIWIGIKLIAENEEGDPEVASSHRLWTAIRTVIVADAVMSLDNVVGVAAAAKGSLALLVFGLVISIPIVVFASQVIMKLVGRFPILVVAGGGLLGWIAGELALGDAASSATALGAVPFDLRYALPVAATLVVVAAGLARKQQRSAREPRGVASNL